MKAVIVIDMPEACVACQLYVDGWCYGIEAENAQEAIYSEKPSWCPLRPLPQRRTQPKYEDSISLGFRNGWNDCLDAITGEE